MLKEGVKSKVQGPLGFKQLNVLNWMVQTYKPS